MNAVTDSGAILIDAPLGQGGEESRRHLGAAVVVHTDEQHAGLVGHESAFLGNWMGSTR